ncbi:MAG: hypothetical protein KAT15_21900, partial [Bacteroidales bacterium]|nr:hypothetical protein [Bacteroidales bacterium]
MICLPIFCQEGPIAAAVPNLEILEITLADQNGNMIIEANESCILLFKLKNSGGRSANSVKIKLTHIAPENFDINYRSSRSLLVVKANSIREVSFPIIVGDRVPESFVEFQIEVIEPNGFDAFPAKIELETAQGSIKQTSDSQQPEPVMVERKDTSTLVIKGFHFKDHNNNDFLEAYETSFFQFRLFNLGEEDVNSIHVHMEQTDDEISGINFLKSLDLDYYRSYYFQDISIPVKGSKNLADGMAEFQVYLTEESGLKSNHQLVRINTRKYERPDLKIINAEFSGQDGDRIRRNEPINLKLEIKNEGRGTAYEVESTLKLIYDHIELVDSDPIIRFEEIQGGETAEVNYQLMASSRYFLPELPVILELSEEISDTFLDTMFMASLDFPEEKKPETTTTKQEPQRTEEITAKDQEVTETAVQQISLPDLTTHRQEFEDEDNNNVINVGESCSIMFNIKNSGKGPANDVTVSVQQLNESIKGLHFPVKFNLGTIEPGQEEEISIPVRGLESLTSDLAEFRIEVLETRGFDAIPLVLEVKTQEILEPGLTISSAAFMNETGQLKRNYPIELRIALKNNGPGHASDLKIKFDLPDVTTCVLLGESDIYELEKLGSGESKTFSLLFTATRRYTADQIPVNVKISESHRKFGIDTVLVGNLNAEAQVIQKYQVQPRIIEKQVEEPVAEVRGGGDPLKSIGFEEASKEIGMEIGR